MKDIYVEKIIELLKKCQDESLIELVYQLLIKSS
jgi:hypothetical protein